ncbi:hypothetical protein Hanom_Chr01g00012441 [Helianthus anomalus]
MNICISNTTPLNFGYVGTLLHHTSVCLFHCLLYVGKIKSFPSLTSTPVVCPSVFSKQCIMHGLTVHFSTFTSVTCTSDLPVAFL